MMATKPCFAQLGTKTAAKEFGQDTAAAILKEVKQLEGKKIFKARATHELTEMERKRAQCSISLVTKKRDGRIKGRRDYIPRDDINSPTISTDALMLSLTIDAHEGRHVATADIEGAYLHADMDDKVIMLFEGEMVAYTIAINPYYEQYVHTTKKGKHILYVQLLKNCTDACRAHYYGSHFSPPPWKKWVLKSTHRTCVLQTKSSTVCSSQYAGTWMI